jgi:hypothetical protein
MKNIKYEVATAAPQPRSAAPARALVPPYLSSGARMRAQPPRQAAIGTSPATTRDAPPRARGAATAAVATAEDLGTLPAVVGASPAAAPGGAVSTRAGQRARVVTAGTAAAAAAIGAHNSKCFTFGMPWTMGTRETT